MELLDGLTCQLSMLDPDSLPLGVFVAALVETIIPPIPTLAIFPAAGALASAGGHGVHVLASMILAGGLGAAAGSAVIYLVALKLGRTVVLRYMGRFRISEERFERVEAWFGRHGDKAVFFGRLAPVIREMISIPAGLLRMHPAKFAVYTFAGSCVYAGITMGAGYAALDLIPVAEGVECDDD